MDYKFSIIIPIHNRENYLRECLDSLLKQTTQNFQVFLVDDASTDKSKQICNEYIKKNVNFHYKYIDHRGPGGARNEGIRLANSEYIIFLDSDDFLGPNAIKHISNTLEKDGNCADICLTLPIVFLESTNNYFDFYDNSKVKNLFNRIEEKHTGEIPFVSADKYPEILGFESSVWRCVWKTDFLKSNFPVFPERIFLAEDAYPHTFLFKKAKRIILCKEGITFFYRKARDNQLTSGTDAMRFDLPVVFSNIFFTVLKEKWNVSQLSYVISNYLILTHWSLLVIDDSYRKEFVVKTHQVLKKISFLKFIKSRKKANLSFKLFFMGLALRSHFLSKALYNRKTTNKFLKLVKKVFRKKW